MRGTESAEYGEDCTVSKPKNIYLIGSLRNPEVPKTAKVLRAKGYEVFDDWFAAGKFADRSWRQYEIDRGHTYQQALQGYAAEHVYSYDKHHLDRADCGVLVLPAGRSGHLELGYLVGRGKPGYILLDKEYNRWDVMLKFATVVSNMEELIANLQKLPSVLPRP